MSYCIEYRRVWNDVHVGPWTPISKTQEWAPHPTSFTTPYAAYGALADWLEVLPQPVGFTEMPDCGKIRTDAAYGRATLFAHPLNDSYQYRIVNDAPSDHNTEDARSRVIQL